VLSAIDDLADTIRPRLDAAGADPRQIYVIPSIADLRHDFYQLRAAINQAPNCRFIIIDPINAYVGAGDSHFQTVVQKVLAPLAELAAEKRIAVLAIAHVRKTEGAAIHRAAGSVGFVAAARSVWTICRDPENRQRHLLLPLKNNLTPTATGLAYTIQSNDAARAPAITWEPSVIQETAETILAPKKRGPQAIELEDASDWLQIALSDGPRSADDLIRRATQFGFHERTLRRALYNIAGHTQNRGPLSGWWWSLTPQEDVQEDLFFFSDPAPPERPPEKLVRSRKTCPLSGNSEVPPKRQPLAPHQRRTGNPLLDGLLDTILQPFPTNTS
jgi:hypothetical protein